MKKQLSMLAVCGAMLLFSASVFAQSHGHDHGNGDAASDSYAQQDHRGNDKHDHGNDHGRDDRDGRGDQARDERFNGMHDRGRHEGWYKRGGRVPEDYRSGDYVVTDWHRAHLRQPPRGYRWVRSDNGDFLMIAAATGIIAEILANH